MEDITDGMYDDDDDIKCSNCGSSVNIELDGGHPCPEPGCNIRLASPLITIESSTTESNTMSETLSKPELLDQAAKVLDTHITNISMDGYHVSITMRDQAGRWTRFNGVQGIQLDFIGKDARYEERGDV